MNERQNKEQKQMIKKQGKHFLDNINMVHLCLDVFRSDRISSFYIVSQLVSDELLNEIIEYLNI